MCSGISAPPMTREGLWKRCESNRKCLGFTDLERGRAAFRKRKVTHLLGLGAVQAIAARGLR